MENSANKTSKQQLSFCVSLSLMQALLQVSANSVKVCFHLLLKCNQNSQFFLENVDIAIIAEKLNISKNAVAKSAIELEEKEIILPISHPLYVINPKYTLKGSIADNSGIVNFK